MAPRPEGGRLTSRRGRPKCAPPGARGVEGRRGSFPLVENDSPALAALRPVGQTFAVRAEHEILNSPVILPAWHAVRHHPPFAGLLHCPGDSLAIPADCQPRPSGVELNPRPSRSKGSTHAQGLTMRRPSEGGCAARLRSKARGRRQKARGKRQKDHERQRRNLCY